MQGVLLALFALSHYMRYRIAKVSIAQKAPKKMISFIVVTVLLITLYVFQLRLQTYVTLGDWVLNWVGVGLSIAEIFAAIWVLIVYQGSKKSK